MGLFESGGGYGWRAKMEAGLAELAEGEDVVVLYDGEGEATGVVPVWMAESLQQAGAPVRRSSSRGGRSQGRGRTRGGDSGRRTGRSNARDGARKTAEAASEGLSALENVQQQHSAKLNELDGKIGAIQNALGQLGKDTVSILTPGMANPNSPDGMRPLAGTVIDITSGAVGANSFGPASISPASAIQIGTLVCQCVEDTWGAAAVGQQTIGPAAPFWVTSLSLGGSNAIRSTTPAVPGDMFQTKGSNYGYPVGVGRAVGLSASSPVSISGSWSPRMDGGNSAGDFVAAVLGPRLV